MTESGARPGGGELVEVAVVLTPEQVAALLQLCDAVTLRGPASKMLVAQAQGRLMRALEVGAVKGEGPAG